MNVIQTKMMTASIPFPLTSQSITDHVRHDFGIDGGRETGAVANMQLFFCLVNPRSDSAKEREVEN